MIENGYEDMVRTDNRIVLFLGMLFAVFMLSMVFVSAIETKGGVYNWGFEYGTGTTTSRDTMFGSNDYGWGTVNVNNANFLTNTGFSTTQKYTGNQSIFIDVNLTSTSQIGGASYGATYGGTTLSESQQKYLVPLKPSTTYKVSGCFYKTLQEQADSGIGFRITTYNSAGARTSVNRTATKYTDLTLNSWDCRTQNFTTGLTDVGAIIAIFAEAPTAYSRVSWYFDDFRIEEVDSVSLSTQASGRPSLTITGVTDTNAIDQSQTTNDSDYALGYNSGNNYIFQTFTPTQTKLTSLTLKLNKFGNPLGNTILTIRTTSAGKPTNTILASYTIANSTISTGGYVAYNYPTPAILTSGTQYAFVLQSNGTFNATDYITLGRQNVGSYAGGNNGYSADASTWSAETGDLYFTQQFAKLSSSVDLNVVAPDGTSELKSFDVNGDILTDANITINPDGTGRYYYYPTFRNTYSGFKYDYFTDITSVNYGDGLGLTSNLRNGLPLNITIRNIDFIQKFVLPNNCTLNGLTLTPNVEIQVGRDMNIAYSSDGSTFSLWSDLNSGSYTPLNTTALNGNNVFYLKFGAKTNTTYVKSYIVDANLSCPTLATPLFKQGTNTIYTMNKDADNQAGATLTPSLMSNLDFSFTTPPVTTFSSFQVEGTTDQNITLSCTSINGCKAINYNINNEGWKQVLKVGVPKDGLVAYYNFDETTGAVVDSHGSNNGINNGATRGVTGIIDNAYSFNGTSDQVQLNNESNFDFEYNDAVSFSAWIKTSSTNATIFSKFDGTNKGYSFRIANSKLSFIQWSEASTGKYNEIRTNSNYNNNTWYHVVAINDGTGSISGFKIYVDGSLVTSTSISNNRDSSILNNNILSIGSNNSSDYFNGLIDEAGIWSRALTSDEITKLYNSGSGLPYNGEDINNYSFIYSGAGDNNIQYFSTDNSDNTETIKTSNFTTYGLGHFHFIDENTYAPVTTTYTITPSINGVSTGTGTSVDLNLQGITNTTYTFTFKKTGYGTRYYYTDLNQFSSFDYNQLMLQDTNGNNEVDLTIYTYNGTTILPNTPITITKNNYLVGRYLTDSTGTINPFLKDQDVNYLFNVEGYYGLGQVAILFNRPKWDSNLGDIAGTWQITLTSPQTTTRYLITTNSQKIAILPNTIEDYSAKVCMYGTSNCNTDYISRTFLLSYKGNSGETLIQPYLNLVSASTLRTLKVLNYGTAQPYPDAKLEIRTKTEAGVDYLVESVITDSTGLATTYLNDGQTYYITANDVTVYKVTPNDTVTTYYIYFNYINLPSSTITPIDVNTSNDTNTLIGQVYGVRNALFNSCTLQNDCFPAVFFSILITFLVLISVTNITQANNPVGVKGLALIAFCSLTIFFGIGWLPVYIYAFLGAISMLLVVIVQ